MRMIRTLVAEPTALIREGLVSLLGREQEIELIAAVQHAEEIMPTARKLMPQVALIAAAFPDHDGVIIARNLCTAIPVCRSAILSHDRHPRNLDRAIASHVYGYLVIDCSGEFLIEAIRQIAAGNKVLDPGLAYSVMDTRPCPLTLREAEALRAAAKGFTTAEIAGSLGLSLGTARNYLSRAIAKLGARNRVEAIRIADESGWL
jgi:two-component system response regulator DesR